MKTESNSEAAQEQVMQGIHSTGNYICKLSLSQEGWEKMRKAFSALIYCVAATSFLFGAALTAGAWKLVFNTIIRINPVSQEFSVQLAGMIGTIGPIGMLLGTLLLIAKVVLSGKSVLRTVDIALVGMAALVVMLFFSHVQPETALNDGMAWDGTQYHSMCYYFKNGKFPVTEKFGVVKPVFPYNQRVLVPFLAAQVPLAKTGDCFRVVNTGFLVAAAMFFYLLWVRFCAIPKHVAFFGLFFFMFHWVGPFRSLNNCVFSVDAPVYMFEALLLCSVLSRKFIWLLLIAPLATLCKEQFVYIFLVLFLYTLASNLITGTKKYPIIFFAGATLLALVVNSIEMRFPFKGIGFGGFTVAFFTWRRLYDPLTLIRWTVALFTAYGALGILSLIPLEKQKTAVSKPSGDVIPLSLLFVLFSMCGATDMTRVAFLGFPFIMAWILPRISCRSWQSILGSFLLTIPVMRLVQGIPEPAAPLPCNDQTGCYSWVPEYADIGLVTAWGLYFVVCWIVLAATHKEAEVT